jgi:predicted dienelactone hydrolase
VPELLRLAARELRDAVARQVLAERAVDGRRVHQEALGQLQVAVVLHHAGEEQVGQRRRAETR